MDKVEPAIFVSSTMLQKVSGKSFCFEKCIQAN